MEKTTGRNAPCPCGSGRKYKTCCLRADQESARAERPEATEPKRAPASKAIAWNDVEWDDDDLDELSNGVIDLIKAGHLDEAERTCEELQRRYPQVYDGLERMGMVLEARGDTFDGETTHLVIGTLQVPNHAGAIALVEIPAHAPLRERAIRNSSSLRKSRSSRTRGSTRCRK